MLKEDVLAYEKGSLGCRSLRPVLNIGKSLCLWFPMGDRGNLYNCAVPLQDSSPVWMNKFEVKWAERGDPFPRINGSHHPLTGQLGESKYFQESVRKLQRAAEMAQQPRDLAALPEDQSLFPSTHWTVYTCPMPV